VVAGDRGREEFLAQFVTASPDMAGARNSRRTSSEPNRASAGVAMSVCTPIAIGTPPQRIWPSVSANTIEKL
jgi:hypothetical protein